MRGGKVGALLLKGELKKNKVIPLYQTKTHYFPNDTSPRPKTLQSIDKTLARED
jgi:hypothetical protein